MSVYRGLLNGLIIITVVLSCISCFYAIGKIFIGKPSYIAVAIGFGLLAIAIILNRICLPKEKDQFLPDQLEYEPTRDQILAMNLQEQNDLVKNARMKEGCRPDDWGNRAKIRACYLINEAYKPQGHMQKEEQQ